MPFKISTKSEEFVVFCGAYWVKTFFFRCHIFIEIWFLNKNWTQKLSFWKIFFFQSMLIRKVFYSISAGTKNSQFKIWLFEIFLLNFSLCRKTFASESDSFFWKISFQTLIFNEKVCYKVMPFKMSTQSEKLVVVRGANRVETLFPRRDFFIEIWFLNKKWTQNLIFRKILSPQNEFSNSILSKTARTKNSRFKNWSICRKKTSLQNSNFFSENSYSKSDFQWKGLLQNHAF